MEKIYPSGQNLCFWSAVFHLSFAFQYYFEALSQYGLPPAVCKGGWEVLTFERKLSNFLQKWVS